jgi:flagellin
MSRIQTNVAANSAYRNLSMTSTALEKSITRLSSGFRLNRSADDAAGMAIANKLRAESRSLQQASRNAAQANSMLQIADGAVSTVSGILDRMKELATASNSASIGTQRTKLDAEFQALKAEIGRIASTTQYQGGNLVDGSLGLSVQAASTAVVGSNHITSIQLSGAAADTYTFTHAAGVATLSTGAGAGDVSQVLAIPAGVAGSYNFDKLGITIGVNASVTATDLNALTVVVGGTASADFMVSSSGNYGGLDRVSLTSINLSTGATGLNIAALDVLSSGNAVAALSALDSAIDASNTAIGTLGAAQSRIEFASANVATITQNVIAAESTIRDADMALESTLFTKYQILQQAGTAMLAQANASAQNVLSLLR